MREVEGQPMKNSSGTHKRTVYKKKPCKSKKKPLGTLAGVIVAFVLIIVFSILIFGGSNANQKLVGKWKYDQYTEYEFLKDGKGCLSVDDVRYEYTYETKAKKLSMDFEKDIVTDCEYSFEINGNKLTLVGGEGTDGGTYELTKES